MSASLPAEILDLIVDHLHDDTITLKASCLVSKSWIPRTRRHLFASVELFSTIGHLIDLWMGLFPDPQNSPTQHTRILVIDGLPALKTATTVALPWIHRFHHLVEMDVNTMGWHDATASLVQLNGLSPTLKSLFLRCALLPLSEAFDLICSFPLLEDLTLLHDDFGSNPDESVPPATSPKLTGFLNLIGRSPSIIRRLLRLPNGLHFSKITVSYPEDNAELTVELVSRCSDTLEYLCIRYLPSDFVPPATPLFELSNYSKLKVVKFLVGSWSIKLITMTLQATKPKSLRQIGIYLYNSPFNPLEETMRNWQDLDHLLARLWTSHSILPNIAFSDYQEVLGLKLFPELMRMGVTCEAWD